MAHCPRVYLNRSAHGLGTDGLLINEALPKDEAGAEETMRDRFDLYGALWLLCSRYHSGQWSRGYRILSRLVIAGYQPGLSLQSNRFESPEQRTLYHALARRYRRSL